MNIERKEADAVQTLFLQGRQKLEVVGVTDVIRFDEETVLLATSCGSLTVEGSALHVQTLDLEHGKVIINGKVDSLLYYDDDPASKSEKAGLFGRLFH